MTFGIVCGGSIFVCVLFIVGIAWLIFGQPRPDRDGPRRGADPAAPGRHKSFKARA